MTYRVIVTPEAQVGTRESFQYIHEQAPVNAERWLQGLYDQIDKLERFPARCGSARERKYFEEDLRQLLFKSHRIIFWINAPARTVYVLYVRHAKQRAVGESRRD